MGSIYGDLARIYGQLSDVYGQLNDLILRINILAAIVVLMALTGAWASWRNSKFQDALTERVETLEACLNEVLGKGGDDPPPHQGRER